MSNFNPNGHLESLMKIMLNSIYLFLLFLIFFTQNATQCLFGLESLKYFLNFVAYGKLKLKLQADIVLSLKKYLTLCDIKQIY